MLDPYATLGIARTATAEDIKRAYRTLASQWHPDRNPASNAKATFQNIATAYATLIDADARRTYDLGHCHKEQTGGPNVMDPGTFYSNFGPTPTANLAAAGFGHIFNTFFGDGGVFHTDQTPRRPGRVSTHTVTCTLSDLAQRRQRRWKVHRWRHDTAQARQECLTLEATLKPTYLPGHRLRFQGKGDVHADGTVDTLDLELQPDPDDPFTRLGGAECGNLQTRVAISLKESLLGVDRQITGPLGEAISVRLKIVNPQLPFILLDCGMPRSKGDKRGALHVWFDVAYPQFGLTDAQRRAVSEAF